MLTAIARFDRNATIALTTYSALSIAEHRVLLEHGLGGDRTIVYALTSQGGQAWEYFAVPQWNKYVSAAYDDKGFAPIYGQTRDVIEQFVAQEAELGDGYFTLDTMSWRTLRPWQATYWKMLPHGACVQAQYTWEPIPHPPISMNNQRMWYDDLSTIFMTNF